MSGVYAVDNPWVAPSTRVRHTVPDTFLNQTAKVAAKHIARLTKADVPVSVVELIGSLQVHIRV